MELKKEILDRYTTLVRTAFGHTFPPKLSFERYLLETLCFYYERGIDVGELKGESYNTLVKELTEDLPIKTFPRTEYITMLSEIVRKTEKEIMCSNNLLQTYGGSIEVFILISELEKLYKKMLTMEDSPLETDQCTNCYNEYLSLIRKIQRYFQEDLKDIVLEIAKEVHEMTEPLVDHLMNGEKETGFMSQTDKKKGNIIFTIDRKEKYVISIKRSQFLFRKHGNSPAILNMLIKYSLIGSGTGLHAAVPEKAMEAMKISLGIQAECFASPLNNYFDSYCSLFPETDTVFGSLGNFFQYDFYSSNLRRFECNPPFHEPIIQRMAEVILNYLMVCDNEGRELMFLVILPDWYDCKGLNMLMRSEFLKFKMTLPAGSHQYTNYNENEDFGAVHNTEMMLLCTNITEKIDYETCFQQIQANFFSD